jgi:hypothetical protein
MRDLEEPQSLNCVPTCYRYRLVAPSFRTVNLGMFNTVTNRAIHGYIALRGVMPFSKTMATICCLTTALFFCSLLG